MNAPGKGKGPTAVKIGPGSSAHFKNVHVQGFDTPFDIDKLATATFENVTTSSPAKRLSQSIQQAGTRMGWTPNTRGAVDLRASAAITQRLGGTNPFNDPKELLDRARDHIDDLEARIKAFFDGEPYSCTIDRDDDAGQETHKVILTETLPAKAATVAKDAFTNLRDALDHAVYASSVVLKPGATLNRTGFPFAHDAAGVHDKLNRELLDVTPEIRTFLEALLPHKAGNQLLWGLNNTRNVETHRIIVPLLAASVGNSLRINGKIVGEAAIGQSRWDAAKNEAEYLRVGVGSEVEYELDIAFGVLLGNVEVLAGEPAIDTLYVCTREVEGIVLALEAETARILRAAS